MSLSRSGEMCYQPDQTNIKSSFANKCKVCAHVGHATMELRVSLKDLQGVKFHSLFVCSFEICVKFLKTITLKKRNMHNAYNAPCRNFTNFCLKTTVKRRYQYILSLAFSASIRGFQLFTHAHCTSFLDKLNAPFGFDTVKWVFASAQWNWLM